MPSSRVKAGLLALGLIGAAAWAQKRPESILPPGFGDAPQATPVPAPTSPVERSVPRPTASTPPAAMVQPLPAETPGAEPSPGPSPTPTPTATPDPAQLAEYELPGYARRGLDAVGVIGPEAGGVPADGFGGTNGRALERWMRGLRTPIASRWLQITLRRTLLSRVNTPGGVNGADFAAERAWLLIRMGEPVAARALVSAVDNADYTPKLYQIALQASLASADPAGLCQIDQAARARDPERAWPLVRAMCVALAGAPAAGQAQLLAARRSRIARGVDLALAQKVAGVAGQGRQAATIDWDSVDTLTAWRWGLATATGATVPDALYATAGPQLAGWRALAPAIPAAQRAAPAEAAAAAGVLSNAALVDLYSALDDASGDDDAGGEAAAASTVASDLRSAYTDSDRDARRAALRRLWGGSTDSYGRIILTARAAALLPPRAGDEDADRLVAAMLSAGLDRTAMRWREAVSEGGDAWAMLLLADPDASDRVSYRALSRYAPGGNAALKQRFLFAGLAGLGRLAGDDVERGGRELGVATERGNAWTRAIDRAAQDNEPATVALLAAIGMQTAIWRDVPPVALFHIVAALRATGQEGAARMVAAEAIARA